MLGHTRGQWASKRAVPIVAAAIYPWLGDVGPAAQGSGSLGEQIGTIKGGS